MGAAVVGTAVGHAVGLVEGAPVGQAAHPPLAQSSWLSHPPPMPHGGHAGPPQSTSVSPNPRAPSKHAAGVGARVIAVGGAGDDEACKFEKPALWQFIVKMHAPVATSFTYHTRSP